jgi:propionyl-CoA synthetase
MEEVLNSHPSIAESAVVGTVDEIRGEIPVGFVVIKKGYDNDDSNLLKK